MVELKKGVLVATDQNTEWLLEWWWGHYSNYNAYPVIFVDLGMSCYWQSWCRSRGELIILEGKEPFVFPKSSLSPDKASKWEEGYLGDLWKARRGWFKKPFACLKTFFDLTVWIDLDCEVCGSLKPLFDEWNDEIQLALVNDERGSGKANYSSGVILFTKNAPFLEQWAIQCCMANDQYMGDQNILTDLLESKKIPFKEISPIYNWIMYRGFGFGILIAHWGAGWGKEYIKKYGGLHQLTDNLRNQLKLNL